MEVAERAFVPNEETRLAVTRTLVHLGERERNPPHAIHGPLPAVEHQNKLRHVSLLTRSRNAHRLPAPRRHRQQCITAEMEQRSLCRSGTDEPCKTGRFVRGLRPEEEWARRLIANALGAL